MSSVEKSVENLEAGHKNKRLHVFIFVIGVFSLAIAGGLINVTVTEMDGIGSLLFILSPIMMVLFVRIVLRAGWRNAGLKLNLRQSWKWYVFALLAYPVSFMIVITIGVALGATTIKVPVANLAGLLLVGMGMQLVPRMLFALSEEWAWRGYLEPTLAGLGIRDFQRHLMVGVIWGVWHFPLILSTDYTDVPMWLYLPLFVFSIVLLAIVYGRMRQRSGSVWPAVIMHGLANTMGFAILEQDLLAFNRELLAGLHPVSLPMILMWGMAAAWLILGPRRKASDQTIAAYAHSQ